MSSDVRSMASEIQNLVQLLRDHSDSEYGGEVVPQVEHALQSAFLGEHAGASAELITAALLHDIGHLLHHLPDDAPDCGIDDHHEVIAARRLKKFFRREVVEPVRMHVAAKRDLCAVEPGYWESHSEPSQVSLKLQGGPMSPEEARVFRDHPQYTAAVSVRRWDDLAKTARLPTATLDHYVPYILAAAESTIGANV